MGLDAVELVMAFEEAFGVEIPNTEAERMRTPRDVVDFVCTRVPVGPSGPCETQRAFYRLRRALRTALPDTAVRPATRARDLANRESWPVLWERARGADGGADWPDVRWRRWPLGAPGTMRALALELVPRVTPPEPGSGGMWTRERIGLRVRQVMAHELGITDFAMRDEFVRDMGIN
jgi:hypothetical protein